MKRHISLPLLVLLLVPAITQAKRRKALEDAPAAQPATSAQAIPAGATAEAGFSPKGGSLGLVIKAIGEARTEILVAAYGFTSKPIALALLDAHKRGVQVQLVADEKSSKAKYSATTFLANQGVPVRTNGNYSIHHHKFMVIDGCTLETGSFNFTAGAADKNAENVLVLRRVPELAATYTKEWRRLWDEAEQVEKAY